jgi:hypothetical protein
MAALSSVAVPAFPDFGLIQLASDWRSGRMDARVEPAHDNLMEGDTPGWPCYPAAIFEITAIDGGK